MTTTHTDLFDVHFNSTTNVTTPPGWTSGETRTKRGYTIIHLIDPDHKDHFITFWTSTVYFTTVGQAAAAGQKIVREIENLGKTGAVPLDIGDFKLDPEVLKEWMEGVLSSQQTS